MNTPLDRVLTPDAAGELAGLTPRQLLIRANRGEFPSIRLPGGEIRYDAVDLWLWIQAHRQPAREAESCE
jgi:hypothetical protein